MVGAAMATERVGPLLGALIVTLPIGAGPSYFFLALAHPPDFIAASALASLAINAVNGVFGLVYVALAQRRGLIASLAAALAAWTALAVAFRAIEWTLLARSSSTQRSMRCACRSRHASVTPRCRSTGAAGTTRRTAVLALSARVGPTATGILATAPMVMTSMALILQPRVGGPAAAAVIANGLTGLVGFGASLVVLYVAALHFNNNAVALTLWLLTSMGWNLCLWALWRWRMVVQSPAALTTDRSSSPPRR
jgi:hypothetical protein